MAESASVLPGNYVWAWGAILVKAARLFVIVSSLDIESASI